MKDVEQKIQQLVQSVVARVHPLCVILFGSAVKPATQAINDLDLLVVMPEGNPPQKSRAAALPPFERNRHPF